MTSYPRYLNLRGSLRPYTPPTPQSLADAAIAAGFDATIDTARAAVVLHNVCRPVWDRHARAATCQQADVWLLDTGTLDRLTPIPCDEHATVAGGV